MKKIYSLLCAMLFTTIAFAQKPVTITGTISNLPEGTEVLVNDYATYSRTTKEEALAKCPVKDGNFTLNFTVNEPRQIVVWVERPHSNKPVIVTPGETITISADKPHGFFEAEVKGSKYQESFNKISRLPYQKDRPQNISQSDYMKQLIKENKNTFFGPLLVYAWSGHSIGYEEFYNMFPKKVQNSYHGRALKKQADAERAEKAKANDPAQKAKAKELMRKTPAYDKPENVLDAIIAQYKGKVVFVDFWATWCAPCRAAMKTIQPLEGWMAENDIVRVYLSAPTSDPTKWEVMIPDIGGNHYQMNDDEWKAIGKRYGFNGIPYYRVYNKQGECTFSHTGYPGNDKMKEAFENALESQPGKVVIKGTAKNMDGIKIGVYPYGYPTRGMTIDNNTTNIANGAYKIVIDAKDQALYHLECARFTAGFVASPGEVIVFDGPRLVKGGKDQELMEAATEKMWAAYNKGRVKIYGNHKALMDEVNAHPERELELKTSAEYIQYADELAAWEKEHGQNVRQFFLDNKDNIFSVASFSMHANMLDNPQELYNALSEEVKNSAYGQSMKSYLENNWVGKEMPDFTLIDAKGKKHNLKKLLKGKNYLIVDFWASWCKPCRRGLPFMREYAKKYKKEKLVMLNISTDKKKDDWLKANKEENLPWTSVWDDQGVANSLGVRAIPSVWLLDKNGKIVFAGKYGDAIGTELRKIFGY
ncbi:MAG: AhpC/TSA family protein [Prevotella sp.]|nr:AhpC/TSA family protein [Prevotella sp.]